MPASLKMVERFEELLQRRTDDSPYDYQSLFSTGGFWARRASQRRLKLLQRVDGALRAMLEPGERVLFLTSGALFRFWESYFFGFPMYLLNRRALVLTTERLILLQIDTRQRPKELRSQLVLRAIATFAGGGLRNTMVRLNSGRRYTVAYVPRQDRRTLRERFAAARNKATRQSAADALEHLCPHCYVPVDGRPGSCPRCGGTFKSSGKAGLLSLLFPGLGDIYLGHWQFAILEMLTATIVWLSVLLTPPPTNAADPRLFLAGFVFLFMHGFDAIATRHVARKGHYPAQAPMRSTRRSPTAVAA